VGRSGGELEHLLDELRAMADGEVEAFVSRWEPQILEETS
jgi:hypothetical protein